MSLKTIIQDIKERNKLQSSIKKTVMQIEKLDKKINKTIYDIVNECNSPEELGALCDLFSLDNKGIRWAWKDAYDNSFGGDTDYNKMEWGDVLFHVDNELRFHINRSVKGDAS